MWEYLIREQQSKLPATKPQTLDPRMPPENAMADKGRQKMVQCLVSSGNAQLGSNAPPKGVLPSGGQGSPQRTLPLQRPASNHKKLVTTMTPATNKPKTVDGFTEAPKGKSAHANWGHQQRSNAGLPSSNRYAVLDNPNKPTATPATQGQTTTKGQKPPQTLPSNLAYTQGPIPAQ